MSNISLERLFDDKDGNAKNLFLIWVNDFIASLEPSSHLVILEGKLDVFLSELKRLKLEEGAFPAKGGYDAASPFKKVAVIYTLLHECDPFVESDFPKKSELGCQSPVTIIGAALAQECLYKAVLKKPSGESTLGNMIDFSDHFFIDLIEASHGIKMNSHFKLISLLFEALAYQKNDAAYPPKFCDPVDYSKAPSTWFDDECR